MSDPKKNPTICVGHGDHRCPNLRLVRTRYAKRCKSCAAKQRQIDDTNPVKKAQMSRAVRWFDGAYSPVWPFARVSS